MVDPEQHSDEARIRADERSRVERELHDLDGRDDRADPDGRDGVVERPADAGDARRDLDDVDDRRDRRIDDDRLEEVTVERTRAFSLGQVISLLAGAALVVLGIFALIETGVETPLNETVEPVMGYDHTPLLGIVEVAVGAVLVLFSLRPGGRWIVGIVGLALLAGAVMVLGELDWVVDELGAEQSYAWIPAAAGVAAIVGALLTPRRRQRVTGVPTSPVAPVA